MKDKKYVNQIISSFIGYQVFFIFEVRKKMMYVNNKNLGQIRELQIKH